MTNFSENLRETIARLVELLHLKPSEQQRIDQMMDKLDIARASNVDRLKELKEEIRVLEARALRKKKEYDWVKIETKRIVAGEIERTFREIDRLRGRENIIASNIERISIAQAKLKELSDARVHGAEETQLDEIAVSLGEAITKLKETDAAIHDLEREKYEPAEAAHMDVEKRMAGVEYSEDVSLDLSEETYKRLKELEGEIE